MAKVAEGTSGSSEPRSVRIDTLVVNVSLVQKGFWNGLGLH